MESSDCADDCENRCSAANDNGSNADLNATMLDEAIFRLARLLGRRIAREHFAAMQAANDNSANPVPKLET
jgi:hypothetical protein